MTTLVHLADDELLRLIDGAADTLQRARWEAHLAACTHCARDAELMRDDAALFRTALTRAAYEADLPAPITFDAVARPRALPLRRTAWQATPAWMRAAAVLMLMAAPVAAIPALREWLVQTMSGGSTDTGVALPPTVEVIKADAGPIRFVPAATFVVRFDEAQAAGYLRIASTSGEEAIFQPEQASDVVPVFAETTLHIRNTPQSTVSYTLHIPASVRSVSVRIGDATVATLDATAVRAGRNVRLER